MFDSQQKFSQLQNYEDDSLKKDRPFELQVAPEKFI